MKKKIIKTAKQIVIFLIVIAVGLICGNTVREFAFIRIKAGLMTTSEGLKNTAAAKLWDILQDNEIFAGDIFETNYLEPQTADNYQSNLESFARSGYKLILCAGAELTGAALAQAARNSDICYIIIDYIPTAAELPKNVVGVSFNISEAVYLTGIIAADVTQRSKIGVVIGEDVPSQNEYAAAFYAGVLAERADIEIKGTYTGYGSGADFAQSIANQMYANKTDIIFAGTGSANTGILESARRRDLYMICSEIDLSEDREVPGNVLVSAVKYYDKVIYDLVIKYIDGELKGGYLKFGLKENGVGIIIPNDKLPVSEETLNKTETAKMKIIEGSLKIPSNGEELLRDFPKTEFMK